MFSVNNYARHQHFCLSWCSSAGFNHPVELSNSPNRRRLRCHIYNYAIPVPFSTRSPLLPCLSQHTQSGMRSSFGKRVWFSESHSLSYSVLFVYQFYAWYKEKACCIKSKPNHVSINKHGHWHSLALTHIAGTHSHRWHSLASLALTHIAGTHWHSLTSLALTHIAGTHSHHWHSLTSRSYATASLPRLPASVIGYQPFFHSNFSLYHPSYLSLTVPETHVTSLNL
jgi:hypothetical protein